MTIDHKIKFKVNSFRVWQYCTKHKWDVSYYDICSSLGITIPELFYIIRGNNWSGKILDNYIESGRARHVANHARLHQKNVNRFNIESEIDIVTVFNDKNFGMNEFRKMNNVK